VTEVSAAPIVAAVAVPVAQVASQGVTASGLRAARELLAATIADGVTYNVLDHEPAPGGLAKPTYITVGVAGVTPTEYQFAIRCYSDTSRTQVDTALDRLEDMIAVVEDAMPVEVPRGNWQLAWVEDQNAYIGTFIAEYPRIDF
jgi:hypothetical protein